MSDLYQTIANSTVGNKMLKAINLPIPTLLERYQPEKASYVSGRVLVGAAPGGTATGAILRNLKDAPEAKVSTLAGLDAAPEVEKAAGDAGVTLDNYKAEREDESKFKALVFDATGVNNTEELRALWDFFHPVIRKLDKCARVLVIGRTPEKCDPEKHTAQRGLEGFTRSVGKEIKKGATSQLIYVDEGAETQLASPLRFFLSGKSAYVSAQVVRVEASDFDPAGFDWKQPLQGQKALVTGASRGIGAAIAQVLARDGAEVVVLDVPAMAEELKQVASRIGGKTLELDITAEDGPQQISDLAGELGGLDIVVHNAGVTRDKTLGNMPDKFWDMTLGINVRAPERINAKLLEDKNLNTGASIIGISSIAGIAGNMGQTNYGTSKAAVIGMVESREKELSDRGMTINAVAPGFIETQMTAAMPFAIREAGRRMNSLNQGGQPVDVAETIAFFASPASKGITGNIVRVCGQSLIGA